MVWLLFQFAFSVCFFSLLAHDDNLQMACSMFELQVRNVILVECLSGFLPVTKVEHEDVTLAETRDH